MGRKRAIKRLKDSGIHKQALLAISSSEMSLRRTLKPESAHTLCDAAAHLPGADDADRTNVVHMPYLPFAELRVELGDDLEQIADEAVVGDLEDRRLLVLVDRDDDLESFIPARCWMAPEMPTAM